NRTARCIDLPDGLSADPSVLTMRLDRTERNLIVVDSDEPAFVVDPNFRVHPAPVIPYRPPAEHQETGGGPSLAAMGGTGLGVLVLAATGMVALRRRQRVS